MFAITTFPSEEILAQLETATPEYMHPNRIPYAVIAEGILTPEECSAIAEECNRVKAFKHEGCGAMTREIGFIPALRKIHTISEHINQAFFQYDLNSQSYSWMQSYTAGEGYLLHMDAAPGRMRKLTSVTLLSDENHYAGGELELFFHPESHVVPRTQGTIVVFQAMLPHKVRDVTSGFRQSINMSFHGPNFR